MGCTLASSHPYTPHKRAPSSSTGRRSRFCPCSTRRRSCAASLCCLNRMQSRGHSRPPRAQAPQHCGLASCLAQLDCATVLAARFLPPRILCSGRHGHHGRHGRCAGALTCLSNLVGAVGPSRTAQAGSWLRLRPCAERARSSSWGDNQPSYLLCRLRGGSEPHRIPPSSKGFHESA